MHPDTEAAFRTVVDAMNQAIVVMQEIAESWRQPRITRHDYTTARVQLRREGMPTPLPIVAIQERALALALRAQARRWTGRMMPKESWRRVPRQAPGEFSHVERELEESRAFRARLAKRYPAENGTGEHTA